jgi:hypothetical protein
MTEFVPSEKGQTIRYPSTANLLIDSLDRDTTRFPDATNFTITPKQNILTGFFTRIALNEIVMDWALPNIQASYGNNTFTATVGATTVTVTLPDGFYTAKQALDALVLLLNATALDNFSITTSTYGSGAYLTNSADWTFTATTLSNALGMLSGATGAVRSKFVQSPNLLPSAYYDFVSDSLTYNQELKDGTTSEFSNNNIVYRWYMAWDNNTDVDGYGYAILQGYRPFIQRRYLSFPKQIKWDNIQPIGQLAFRFLDSFGNQPILISSDQLEYSMTLLVSEV